MPYRVGELSDVECVGGNDTVGYEGQCKRYRKAGMWCFFMYKERREGRDSTGPADWERFDFRTSLSGRRIGE
jgi:hypothetical protein